MVTARGTLVAGIALGWTLAAHAEPPSSTDRQARAWAASCAACHGTDGHTLGAEVPRLAGRDPEQIYRALIEFKNGQRPAATVMHQHAKGYADEELRRIAQTFSRTERKP
ncbi:MAG: c-type cytochrome [Sphaerotilus natans subsp. sulfidivorans]|uniref:c-type cytochrome n=1 Tax=Sphaerotilus sulfidivorans TaxID=639200 RepID=UPI002354D586|nr:c-type cytochrome [Sphaerotilus sulfidivorans]MCK6403239.1 c-type cytochrome [Sphaerotilus sulfidivorans]